MTRETSNDCYAFRTAFVDAVYQNMSSKTQLHNLLQLAEQLEHALRSDLGIPGIGEEVVPNREGPY